MPNVEFPPACEPCNMSELNRLQWLWMCIKHLIVFNIIPLWGLFLFCLLAELIPFLSQHVGGAASNQLTNTDHRQAGGKWLPTPSAPLSLKQHFINAESELITWRSYNGTTGRSANIDKVLIQQWQIYTNLQARKSDHAKQEMSFPWAHYLTRNGARPLLRF